MQFVMEGLLVDAQRMPPPSNDLAELFRNRHCANVGLVPLLLTAPPASAAFASKVQLRMTGALPEEFSMPPPKLFAELERTMQLDMLGLPPLLKKAAPRSLGNVEFAFAAVMMKPSMTAESSTPLPVTT